MEIFRYWVGASPEAPAVQHQDLELLHAVFRKLDRKAVIEQYGSLGSMILLKVETQEEIALEFEVPDTVVAFEHRRHVS